METAEPTRQLKIFCPEHQSVFEVEDKPQIVCEIREHSLSKGFPKSEYWEYCCDCRTFSPSRFGTGDKAKNVCPHCDRTTAKRFLCGECKIVAYDSDTETKGKFYSVNAADGIAPNCPGCQKTSAALKIHQHKCTDIEGLVFTSREDCPFCLKSVLVQPAPPKTVEPIPKPESQLSESQSASSTQCPNCGHWGRADRAVCGKCGVWLISPGAGVTAGTSAPKTQLLGSICPNCGTANEADSLFCVNCAQALKTAPNGQTVVNPYVISPGSYQYNSPSGQTAGNFQLQEKPSRSNFIYFTILGGIGFFLLIALIAFNASKPPAVSSNVANYSTSGSNVNKPVYSSNNSTYSGNANKPVNTSSSVIGRTGRLTRNMNIRSASNKFSEILGTHYENARVEILDTDSYYTDEGEYSTWYRVKVLENGYDRVTGNGTGNNWERDGYFGWMEAEMEGWMNSKYISLD